MSNSNGFLELTDFNYYNMMRLGQAGITPRLEWRARRTAGAKRPTTIKGSSPADCSIIFFLDPLSVRHLRVLYRTTSGAIRVLSAAFAARTSTPATRTTVLSTRTSTTCRRTSTQVSGLVSRSGDSALVPRLSLHHSAARRT